MNCAFDEIYENVSPRKLIKVLLIFCQPLFSTPRKPMHLEAGLLSIFDNQQPHLLREVRSYARGNLRWFGPNQDRCSKLLSRINSSISNSPMQIAIERLELLLHYLFLINNYICR